MSDTLPCQYGHTPDHIPTRHGDKGYCRVCLEYDYIAETVGVNANQGVVVRPTHWTRSTASEIVHRKMLAGLLSTAPTPQPAPAVTPPEEHATDPVPPTVSVQPPPSDNTSLTAPLAFEPGAFIYRGHHEPLGGYPGEILRALSRAKGHPVTAKQLQDDIWRDDAPEEGTVKSHVSKARQALQRAMEAAGVNGPADPIPVVDRGAGRLAWRLDLP